MVTDQGPGDGATQAADHGTALGVLGGGVVRPDNDGQQGQET
jgi:hypothetical protein